MFQQIHLQNITYSQQVFEIMYGFSLSESYKIWLPVLFAIQLGFVLYSNYLLIKGRYIYPIKQLSPIITILIQISIILTSTILLICRLTTIHNNYNGVLALMSILYVFFREFIIVAFYMRCLRICAAYFNTQSKIIIAIFSREIAIGFVSAFIAAAFAIVQGIQYFIYKDVNKMTNFFMFYFIGDYKNDPLDFFPVWTVNNFVFFIVYILSLKVHQRFKFVRSLFAAFVLFHLQSIYSLVIMFFSEQISQKLKNNFEIIIMVIHTVFILIILAPSMKPNQHQHPLPIQKNLSNPYTALLDPQTFMIISQFSDQLESRSMTVEQRKRHASSILWLYATLKIAQKKIAQIELSEKSSIVSQLQKDQIKVRQILFEFIYEQLIPALQIEIVKKASVQLFVQESQMSQQNVRQDIQIQHFRQLNKVLDNAVTYSFNEWKKTKSYYALKQEFRNNSNIINTMNHLNIGI